jgi:formylmethanofuran dehydrogenase subunit D
MEQAVPTIGVNLVTYESIYVSLAALRDGLGQAYRNKAAVVHLSPADMKRLQIRDGGCVELSTASGSVVVAAESDADCEEGTGRMPLSLYSNRLAVSQSSRWPLPNLRLIEAMASPAGKGVTPIEDLLVRRRVAQERPATAADL